MGHATALSTALGWTAFVATHVGVVLQLVHILNDPLGFGVNTIDAASPSSDGCEAFSVANAKHNALLFLFWTVQHSGMARPQVKEMLGVYGKPIERGIYGVLSVATYGVLILFWKPVTDCRSFDLFKAVEEDPVALAVGAATVAVGTVFVLSMLYMLVSPRRRRRAPAAAAGAPRSPADGPIPLRLAPRPTSAPPPAPCRPAQPDHVFGVTAEYNNPKLKKKIIYAYPYDMVRHPASGGFILFFWGFAIMARGGLNHVFWASAWTAFVLLGTYFEEIGLEREFGDAYRAYRKQVWPFFPKPLWFLGQRARAPKKA